MFIEVLFLVDTCCTILKFENLVESCSNPTSAQLPFACWLSIQISCHQTLVERLPLTLKPNPTPAYLKSCI